MIVPCQISLHIRYIVGIYIWLLCIRRQLQQCVHPRWLMSLFPSAQCNIEWEWKRRRKEEIYIHIKIDTGKRHMLSTSHSHSHTNVYVYNISRYGVFLRQLFWARQTEWRPGGIYSCRHAGNQRRCFSLRWPCVCLCVHVRYRKLALRIEYKYEIIA